ncbi:hypothetical protein JYP51_21215 [Ponticoccus gilvus]|nr:hypothetical protein [Enemella evansiae]
MATAERTEAVQKLFRAISGVASAKGTTIAAMIDQINDPVEPTGPDHSNFRKGKLSAAKAKLIHDYLEAHCFDQAKALEPDLFPMNPQRALDRFIDKHQSEGGMRIVPCDPTLGLVQQAGHATKAVQTLRLGQEFILELTSPYEGACIAFHGHQGQWHPIPIESSARYYRVGIKTGTQFLPYDAKGNPIPLCEEHWTGPNSFVVITSTDKRLPSDPKKLVRRHDDTLRVYRTDIRFAVNDDPSS